MDPEREFVLLFAGASIWIAGGVAVSILYRRRAGKPIFSRAPSDALFLEKGASGASLRSVITRLGGASNALIVAVTPSELIIRPRFPFNLLFLPEIYGLEHAVPRQAVQTAEVRKTLLGKMVRLEFRGPRRDEVLDLKLRDADAFLRALRS